MSQEQISKYELQTRAELEAFAHNEGLDQLAALFGAEELSNNTTERLAQLQELASANWDFRKGAERQSTNWDNEQLDDPDSAVWQAIFDGASKLGLAESSQPANKTPNYLVILGGANKAPLDRLKYGLENIDDFGHIVYLGSSRPVSDAEREKAADYAPGAQTEFDLGCGAIEATFPGATVVDEIREERNGDTWATRIYTVEVGDESKTAVVLNTPFNIHDDTRDNTRRATTYDNYRFFAHGAEIANDPEASVVAVTTGFYTAAQHMPGVQELTLPFGTSIETIGHDAAYSGTTRKPSQLLQETKAAIDAAVRLDAALNNQ